MQEKTMIFICSPLRGDTEKNIERAKRYCRFVFSKGHIPFAPHVFFTQFLDEKIAEEREAGIRMGLCMLLNCSEVWVFGNSITGGMEIEIAKAKKEGLTIRFFNDKCEEVEL